MIERNRDHHLSKLHGELLDAGLDATATVKGDGGTLRVEPKGLAEAEIDAVLDSHDPTPPPEPPDPDDELDAGLAEVAARDDVPEWGQALIANLRGQGGHAGRAAGRRPE